MNLLKNIYASVFKEIVFFKRTIMNTITSIVVFYVIFLLVSKGVMKIGTNLDYGSTMQGIIVAYYSWTMILSVFTSVGYIVENNRNTGVLENIMLNSPCFTFLLLIESFTSMLLYFLFSWLNLFLFKITAGVEMSFRFFSTGYLLLIGLLSVLGISLFIAGINTVLKKANAVLTVLQFAFLGILFLPVNSYTKIFVPFTVAKTMLKKVMVENISALSLPIDMHISLWINTLLFLLFGIITFNWFIKAAKKKGLLKFF